jgi:hypothetical protein
MTVFLLTVDDLGFLDTAAAAGTDFLLDAGGGAAGVTPFPVLAAAPTTTLRLLFFEAVAVLGALGFLSLGTAAPFLPLLAGASENGFTMTAVTGGGGGASSSSATSIPLKDFPQRLQLFIFPLSLMDALAQQSLWTHQPPSCPH